ncbi:hypothetical membrane protein [Syntrophus aciditrophicus SB]|uniref:Hypothetical membrane protein n=2 Tax=Syntrophus TaxID=43773 RepID=Q2LQK6_SYNAS|nr:hypothetical membrane protein [Syntrophus aciditrophicus SB]
MTGREEEMKNLDYDKSDRRLGWTLLGLILLWVVSGCGYHFVGGEDNIDPRIQKVFVDTFANRTSQAGLESLFRNAFIDQVLRSSRFQLAGRREEADAIIRGSIQRLNTTHLSYQTTDLAAEERVTVVMEVTLEERVSKKILWQNQNFSYYGDYPVASGSLTATETERQSAIAKLAGDAAERAYSLMLSGF